MVFKEVGDPSGLPPPLPGTKEVGSRLLLKGPGDWSRNCLHFQVWLNTRSMTPGKYQSLGQPVDVNSLFPSLGLSPLERSKHQTNTYTTHGLCPGFIEIGLQ